MIKLYFIDPNTKEIVQTVEAKSIEYTLKPESELKEMPNPLREAFLNSGSKLE